MSTNYPWERTKLKKASAAKLPAAYFSRDVLFQATIRTEVQGVRANDAFAAVLDQSAEILSVHGLNKGHYAVPGQSIGIAWTACRQMIASDAYWYDLALQAGMKVTVDRPKGGTTNGTPPGTLAGIPVDDLVIPPPLPKGMTRPRKRTASPTSGPAPTPAQVPTVADLAVAGTTAPEPGPATASGPVNPTRRVSATVAGLEAPVPPAEWDRAFRERVAAGIEADNAGQLRRAILASLAAAKDRGENEFGPQEIGKELVRQQFLPPDRSSGGNNNCKLVSRYLGEMGIHGRAVPAVFPTLVIGKVVTKAVTADPTPDTTDALPAPEAGLVDDELQSSLAALNAMVTDFSAGPGN